MNIAKKLFTSFATLALIAFFSKVIAFDESSSESSSPKKQISLTEENFQIGKDLKHCIEQLENVIPQSQKDKEMIKYMKQKSHELMEPHIMHQPKESRKKDQKKRVPYVGNSLPLNYNDN